MSMSKQKSIDIMIFEQLQQFRQRIYDCFGKAKDALFELMDAVEVDDPDFGRVRVKRWSHFHFRTSPTRDMEIVCVEIIVPRKRRRAFKPLWLAWLGLSMPNLDDLWRQYLRRFNIEHWYRFAKQRLYWTEPLITSLPAAERWTDLVVLMSWQLWLARAECIDSPLPWQSPQQALSPGRVAQAFPTIMAAIGTPAKAPKLRGKSPGRAKGHSQPSRIRFPTVKKRVTKSKKPNPLAA